MKGEIVVRLSMQVPGEEGVDTVSRANSDHSVTVQSMFAVSGTIALH